MADRVRILFIGEIHSSHARGWIDLLTSRADFFDIRAVHLQTSQPPDVPFEVYWANKVRKGSLAIEAELHPLEEQRHLWDLVASSGCSISRGRIREDHAAILYALRQFNPDIVHTFGFDPSALVYALVPQEARQFSRWVLQTRGGSDVAFNRLRPEWQELFKLILPQADAVVCDNDENYRIFADLGVTVRRSEVLPRASGGGGIDLSLFGTPRPMAQRERLLVWNKAYESRWSKGLPVLEALRLAFPHIAPVRMLLTAVEEEIKDWIRLMPADMQSSIEIRNRISHDEMLKLIRQARVVLAPSLVDGIPNTLFEAMAAGAVPVVSPLATLIPHFRDGENVFYARNLYPEEIARAVIKAFNAEDLDAMVEKNLQKVKEMADRNAIRDGVVELYLGLARGSQPSYRDANTQFSKVPVGRMVAGLWKTVRHWAGRTYRSKLRRHE